MKKIFWICLLLICFVAPKNGQLNASNICLSQFSLNIPSQSFFKTNLIENNIIHTSFKEEYSINSLFDTDQDEQVKVKLVCHFHILQVARFNIYQNNFEAFPDFHLKKSICKIFLLNSVFRL